MLQRDINNRYEIISYLGEGTLGSVYLCHDYLRQNKQVAVKVISNKDLATSDADKLLLFRQEFTIMERMNHPNIAKVSDFGFCPENKTFYIAREFIDGFDLGSILKHLKQIPLKLSLKIIISILRALEYIHSRGVVYRDISLENIIIPLKSPENKTFSFDNFDFDKITLFDFGISTIQGKAILQPANIAKEFLAPEVTQHKLINYNSDIFSLGILFYELLTGNIITNSNNTNVITDQTFPITKLIDNLKNESVKKILLRMTSFNHELRYQFCSEVITDINKRLNTTFQIETQATAISYIRKPVYIKRISEISIYDKIEKNPNISQFYLLISDKGSGKSRLLSYLKQKISITNRFVFSIDCKKYSGFTVFFTEYLKLLLPYTSKSIIKKHSAIYVFFNIDIINIVTRKDTLQYSYNENEDLLIKDLVTLITSINTNILNLENLHISESVLLLDNFHYTDILIKKSIDSLIFLHKEEILSIKIIFTCANDEEYLKNKFFTKFGNNDNFFKFSIQRMNQKQIKQFLINSFGKDRLSSKLLSGVKSFESRTNGNPLFLQEILENLIRNNKIYKKSIMWDIKDINDISASDDLLILFSKKLDSLGFSAQQKELLFKLSLLKDEFTCQLLATLSNLEWQEVMQMLELSISENLLSYGESGIKVESPLLKDFVAHHLTTKETNELNFSLGLALYDLIDIYLEDEIKKVRKASVFHICSCDSTFIKELKYPNIKVLFKLIIEVTKDFFSSYRYKDVLHNIDFMLTAGNDIINSIQKIELLNIKGLIFVKYGKLKISEKIFNKCYDYLKKAPKKNNDLFGEVLKNLADLYFNIGEFAKSIEFTNEILTNNKFSDYHIKAHDIAGSSHLALGDFEEAHKHFIVQKELATQFKIKKDIAKAIGNIGLYYWYKKDFVKAKEYYERQLTLTRKFNDTNLLIKPLGNLGIIANVEKKYQKSLDYYNKVLQIAKKYNNKIVLCVSYSNIGSLYLNIGNYPKAKEQLLNSLKLVKESGLLKIEAIIYLNLAILYKDLNDLVKAKKCMEEGYKLIFSLNLSHLKGNICLEGAEIYYTLNNLDMAKKMIENEVFSKTIDTLDSDIKDMYNILKIIICNDKNDIENLLLEFIENTTEKESQAKAYYYLYLNTTKANYLIRAISIYKNLYIETKNLKYKKWINQLSSISFFK